MAQWTRMNREQAGKVLQQMDARDDAVVFSHDVTEVSWRALPFYKNWRLYRLVNYATMPVFTMTYLSDGAEYIALDGTANPIYTVDERDPLMLSKDSVLPYLDFFFSNVQGSEGEVFLIRDPHKMPFLSSFTEGQKQSILQNFRAPDITFDAAQNAYRVTGTLHYGGGLLSATIVITPDGKLSFQEQNLLLTGVYFPGSPYTQAWLEAS